MEIARHWRLKGPRYRLEGEHCNDCDSNIFPPRDVCPHCGGVKCQGIVNFSGKGEIYSYTTVYEAPTGYEANAPYTVALVKLDEGPMITAQLTDLDSEPQIGMPVEMVIRKMRDDGDERGMIIYSYKFKPRVKSSSSSK